MTFPGSKRLCFILMPFKDSLKSIYWQAIKPACIEAGFESLRVDELKGTFNINKKIIQFIFESEAIVADLSGWNPNVFYEMGVAHTIDNKTIMIIHRDENLPFDISNYRCIQYEFTHEGLKELKFGILEALRTIQEWRKQSTNPVQDFKPVESFSSRNTLDGLRIELQRKEKLLKEYEPKLQLLESLHRELNKLKMENLFLRKQLDILQLKVDKKLLTSLPSADLPLFLLRSVPRNDFLIDEVKVMLRDKGFFDHDWNENGIGLFHSYEIVDENQRVIMDHVTGLIWQRSGSTDQMNFEDSDIYINELKQNCFGGYKDWRLPTLEEAMCLMEPKRNADSYINPIFDKHQSWIWTSDKESSAAAWVVNFGSGICLSRPLNGSRYVRAVC